MNIKKVEKQLKKIHFLVENIKEDDAVSAIEKDLLLSYVRSLYEKVLDVETDDQHDSAKRKPKVEKKIEEPAPAHKAEPIAQVVMQEVIAETTQSSPAKEEITVKQTETVVAPEAAPQQNNAEESEISEELISLFNQESGSELSDKLSRSPIADLTKAMGINERIFTIKELFGNDSALFTSTMQTLNNCKSFDEARDYLIKNVAQEQSWDSESKAKKASTFIKLISRRY